MSISYKDSGVDVERGYEAVRLMKEHVKSTYTDGVLGDIGSFGGFFQMPKGMKEPVLVAGTDGVGTKLKYAIISGRHDTSGIDAVAMCVNDIVAEGCRQAGAALIGGETAEMPGFYPEGEYDIAGFAVGVVDMKKIINGSKIKPGDVLVGIKSSGIHSNGYSLVRKLWGEDIKELEKFDADLNAKPIDVLLTPTKIYVHSILELIKKVNVKGIAHITGGGFIENIPRIFPEGVGCRIDTKSYEVPAIFRVMQKKAKLSKQEMYNTFNMGIGMVVCVKKSDVEATIAQLESTGEECVILGKTVKGSGVILK